MAREARKISKSGNYYVVLKGDELFVTKADKEHFVEILERNFETGKVYGYELLKDEIRLVVKEGEKGISLTMKPITTSYARYFNRTHNKEGKLFKDRFKSEPLETQEEIDDAIKGLKKATPKKKTVKKSAPEKVTPKQVKQEIKKEEPKQEPPKPQPQQRRNLPSWLL